MVLDNRTHEKIGVIIINYCGLADTIACVDSVLASSYKNFTIYILDNASPDGSGTDLAETYNEQRHVLVRVLDSNIGFGAANNIGAEHAFRDGCAYALLLNNDTVIDANMISVLHAKSANNKVTVPLMYYYSRPSTIWYGGGYFDVFGIPRHRFTGVSDALELHEEDVRFATGCCMLIPKWVWGKCGGFDPTYFMYWEDVDLSIRMNRSGVRIKFVPEAKLWHKVSSSTGGEHSSLSYYYASRNRLYGIRKLSLGLIPRLWAYGGILRGLISREPIYEYAAQAFIDYRRGSMGQRMF